MDLVSFSKFCLPISFWLFELEWILCKSVLKSEKHIFLWEFGSQMSRLDPWKVIDSQDEWRMSAKRQNLTDYQTKIFGTSLGEKVTKWKDNARRQNLTRIVLQKIWNQFQRKSHKMGMNAEKNRCLATEARSATEACQHFISIKEEKGEVRILNQWHLGIIFIRYL